MNTAKTRLYKEPSDLQCSSDISELHMCVLYAHILCIPGFVQVMENLESHGIL